jgi:hypothetical protein
MQGPCWWFGICDFEDQKKITDTPGLAVLSPILTPEGSAAREHDADLSAL